MGDNNKILDKQVLKDKLVEVAEKEIEVAELNQLMGLDDGEMTIVKIRQLDLDEYLGCQMMQDDQMRNLIEGVITAAEKRGEVEEEILAAYKGLTPQAQYYIDLCIKGTVEPVLVRNHWVFLARRFPLVIERIASEIIVLTKGGADLKKNS